MNSMCRKTIIVIERDGFAVRAFTITFELRTPIFDWRAAVRAACREYVQTAEGRRIYQYNSGCFNWADFAAHVPRELCIKHGFLCCENDLAEEVVNWDEQLADGLDDTETEHYTEGM